MSPSIYLSLGELSKEIGAILEGDSTKTITGINSLMEATSEEVSFFSRQKYSSELSSTLAGAVIISKENKNLAPCDVLIMQDPYLGYARATKFFKSYFRDEILNKNSKFLEIHKSAQVSDKASIGSFVSIGKNTVVSENSVIGNGCFIGSNVLIGQNTLIYPNSSIYNDVIIGKDVIIHSGVVLGSDGLGFAKSNNNWVKVEHLGKVIIGDRVEIGSNCSVDKGSVGDTVIEKDVKIDNLVHIAHNVSIGEASAIAANSAVAGSTIIGKRCTIAGCCGLVDNISLSDDVHITAMSLVTKSIKVPGIYSSGTPLMNNKEWKRNAVIFKKLHSISKKN